LRKRPWLDLLGPEYIDLAFHTAAAADPRAHLILNECFIEHQTDAEVARRDALLQLALRLRRSGVPISGIGIQGHLRGTTPLDRPGLTAFLQKIRDLGLDIMVTELDVDDHGIAPREITRVVASKYAEFLSIVGPFVSSVTFEALRNEPTLPRRPDGVAHSPNLFDEQYRPTPAFQSTAQVLREMHPANRSLSGRLR
jgi:endo-1,4-beta-xylanase